MLDTDKISQKVNQYRSFMNEIRGKKQILSEMSEVVADESEKLIELLYSQIQQQRIKIECLNGKINELQRSEPYFNY